MGSVRRSLPMRDQHQVFRGVFEDWQTRAGALSALPDAPVVPDDSPREGGAWRRLRFRSVRDALSQAVTAVGGRALADSRR